MRRLLTYVKSHIMGIVWTVFVAVLLTVLFTGCGVEDNARERSVKQRNEVFSQAENLYPNPAPQNFPSRAALVEFTLRQDMINHPWYVYILGDNGNTLGYYVAKTRPINSCNFLSSTEAVDYNNNLVLTAPSLDGIYYGGSGASAGCDTWFFFDQSSNALIEIRGVKFFTADQPLKLNAEPILVADE